VQKNLKNKKILQYLNQHNSTYFSETATNKNILFQSLSRKRQKKKHSNSLYLTVFLSDGGRRKVETTGFRGFLCTGLRDLDVDEDL